MVNATYILQDIIELYMSHRLRAKIQFKAIDYMRNWILDDPESRLMIVIDHKNKILMQRYREG